MFSCFWFFLFFFYFEFVPIAGILQIAQFSLCFQFSFVFFLFLSSVLFVTWWVRCCCNKLKLICLLLAVLIGLWKVWNTFVFVSNTILCVFSFFIICFAFLFWSVRRIGPLIEVGNFQLDLEHLRSIGEAKRLAIQFVERLAFQFISVN